MILIAGGKGFIGSHVAKVLDRLEREKKIYVNTYMIDLEAIQAERAKLKEVK